MQLFPIVETTRPCHDCKCLHHLHLSSGTSTSAMETLSCCVFVAWIWIWIFSMFTSCAALSPFTTLLGNKQQTVHYLLASDDNIALVLSISLLFNSYTA